MPYQPNQQYDTQSLGNGIANAGQNLAQGFQQYQVNQAKDKVAQGELAGLLQSNPDILKGADPDVAKKLEKFKNGETGLKDNIFLLGWANMTQKGMEQKQQLNAQALANQAQQMKIQEFIQNKAEEDAMKAKLGQMNAGIGNGVYSAKTQDNPVSKYAASLFGATGKVPSNDVLEKFATAKYGGENPTIETATVNGTDAQGRPIESTINKRTGQVMGSRVIAPAGVLMPEDAAKAAQLTGRVTQAMKDNQDTIENGKTSVQSLYAIDNARNLLAKMKAAGNETGAFAPLKAEAQNMAKSLGIDISRWVEDTEDFSLSHLKELFTAVVILGDKYEDAVKTLQEMREEKVSSEFDEPKAMGFGIKKVRWNGHE